MTEGGIWRLYNDRTVEITGGQSGERGGVDICITGMKGSVLITAMENGDVLVSGNKLLWKQRRYYPESREKYLYGYG